MEPELSKESKETAISLEFKKELEALQKKFNRSLNVKWEIQITPIEQDAI